MANLLKKCCSTNHYGSPLPPPTYVISPKNYIGVNNTSMEITFYIADGTPVMIWKQLMLSLDERRESNNASCALSHP